MQRIDFAHTDIFDLDDNKGYDLVLCLGLMYHLTDPVTVAKKLYKLTNNLLVVDSTTIVSPEKYLEIGDHEKHPSISKTEFAFIPSKSALIEIFRHAGFSKIDHYRCEDETVKPYYTGTRTLLLLEK